LQRHGITGFGHDVVPRERYSENQLLTFFSATLPGDAMATSSLADYSPADHSTPMRLRLRMPLRFVRFVLAGLGLCLAAPCLAQTPTQASSQAEEKPDIDLYALMSGSCSTLKIDGHEFPCKAVGFFHSETGRAHFSVALDDPTDDSHIISFSGANGRRSRQNLSLYELPIDRMLLNSKSRPKVDGIPVPTTETSAGVCRQIGNFALLRVASVTCSATDHAGRVYEMKFVSDGAPIALRRVRQTSATDNDPYQ
jgi:hypothetical protein